jgi:hypothetical protein
MNAFRMPEPAEIAPFMAVSIGVALGAAGFGAALGDPPVALTPYPVDALTPEEEETPVLEVFLLPVAFPEGVIAETPSGVGVGFGVAKFTS